MDFNVQEKENPLELNFDALNKASKFNSAVESKFSDTKGNGTAFSSSSLENDPTAVVIKGPPRPKHYEQNDSKPKEPQSMNTTTQTTRRFSSSNDINPKPINAKTNIDRQRKEQKTINSLLSSAATMVLIIVLTVGSLAAFGGYVLWKQVQEQSVTINLLEANLRQEIARLQHEVKTENARISGDVEMMNTQVTQLKSQSVETQSNIRKLESILLKERQINQLQESKIRKVEQSTQRLSAADLDRMKSR